jgi:hypothetical protein
LESRRKISGVGPTIDDSTGRMTVPLLTVTSEPLTTSGVGASNGATVSAAEAGDGVWHRTTLTCTATPISISDDAGVAQYGGVKVYDFPAGLICTIGAVIDGSITLGTTGDYRRMGWRHRSGYGDRNDRCDSDLDRSKPHERG